MNPPTWEKAQSGGKQRWNYVMWVKYEGAILNRGMYRRLIGYMTKLKNKHKCTSWAVHYTEMTGLGPSEYIGQLTTVSLTEAKDAARLLIEMRRKP